jgi:hypothetical protein
MRVAVRVRALAVGVGAAALLVAPLAPPASAAKKKPHVACRKVTSSSTKIVGSKITVKSAFGSCTPKALKAGGTQKITTTVDQLSGSIKGTFVWKKKQGSTALTIKFAQQKNRRKCPAGTVREKITGKTGKSKGAAAKIVKVGEPITASICAYTEGPKLGQSFLEKGSKFKL